ncbi:hypothetical protein SNE40_018466 [Patella caerulea]
MRAIALQEIVEAQETIKGYALRTPLIPLYCDSQWGKIYLKLENLQPTGSFKVRGASNALAALKSEKLTKVYTASAGNFAQGLARNSGILGLDCSVVVPDHTPDVKTAAIEQYGGKVIRVPYDTWWNIMINHSHPGMEGKFIHSVAEPSVIAGNGTIGLEILEDLPDVDAVVVPYGGGGLITGISSAIKSKKANVKIFAAEVETAAPLSKALEVGEPAECEYRPSFVDCIGSRSVLNEMWPYVKKLVDSSLVVTLKQIADSMKLLADRNHVIAEGGAAAPVSAALNGSAGKGNIVCVISGGNIDKNIFSQILKNSIPT